MVCAVCNKESNNRRVCPYCFTPYPAENPQGRQSSAGQRQSTSSQRLSTGISRQSGQGFSSGNPQNARDAASRFPAALEPLRAFVMRQTPLVRWSALGIIVVLLLWAMTTPKPKVDLTPGTVPSEIIATPMQRADALALIKHTRETALVDEQSDEISVSYPAATFPVQPEGQFALAQQFARADEIVQGRRRRIFFYNPAGRVFAQADGVTGVTVVR